MVPKKNARIWLTLTLKNQNRRSCCLCNPTERVGFYLHIKQLKALLTKTSISVISHYIESVARQLCASRQSDFSSRHCFAAVKSREQYKTVYPSTKAFLSLRLLWATWCWKDPQPVQSWSGVLTTSNFKPAPMQRPWAKIDIGKTAYLNVWTPGQAAGWKSCPSWFDLRRRFAGGSTSYTGRTSLAKQGVIYVASPTVSER